MILKSASLLAVATLVLIAALIGGNRAEGEPQEQLAPPIEITTELHCAEDNEIVIGLDHRNLPFAWCEQVIER